MAKPMLDSDLPRKLERPAETCCVLVEGAVCGRPAAAEDIVVPKLGVMLVRAALCPAHLAEWLLRGPRAAQRVPPRGGSSTAPARRPAPLPAASE